MNKKILCMFALMLVFVPVFMFAGCGGDDSKKDEQPTTYNISLQLKNAPDEKYYEVMQDPTGKIGTDGMATFSVKFKAGYRPDGLVAKFNETTDAVGTLTDITNSSTYSQTTPISHDVLWTYSLSNFTHDVNVTLDFANCKVGEISLSLDDNLKNGGLSYAIFEDEPSDSIISQTSELTTLIGDKIKTTSSDAISLPYGSYVLFFPQTNTSMLLFMNNSQNSDKSSTKAYGASIDLLNLDYYEYNVGTTTRHIIPASIISDDWNSLTAITTDTPDSPNKFAGTFAVSSLIDGSTVSGLASQTELAKSSGLLSQYSADDSSPINKTFTDSNGTQHSYYLLANSGVVFSNIMDTTVTETRQKTLATTNKIWLEDDLVMSLSGIGSFSNDSDIAESDRDYYYLSTTININDKNCKKYDISEYVIKQSSNYGYSYYIYIPKAELRQILEAVPEFVTEFKGNQYGFAYLVRDKNESISNVVVLTLENFDFVSTNPNPKLIAYNKTTTNANDYDNAQYGVPVYVDYANSTADEQTAPIYYLNTNGLTSGYSNSGLLITLPVIKFVGTNIQAYESFTYTLTSSKGDSKTNTWPFTKDNFTNMYSGTTVMFGISLDRNYTLKITLNEKAFDETDHTISSVAEREIYYYTASLSSTSGANGIPTTADGWKNLKDNPITQINFKETKILYLLTELNTTETDTQTITENLSFCSREEVTKDDESDTTNESDSSDGATTTEYSYDSIYTASTYKDMLGHTAKITINDKTYTVTYLILNPSYYSDTEYFINITTTTTDKTTTTPTE